MKTIRPFGAPGHTQFDNDLLDHIMPTLSGSGWKILCVAVRKTWGWIDKASPTGRKQWDRISYSQFRKGTGIVSDATIRRAIDENLENAYLLRRKSGPQSFSYHLNTSLEIEVEENTSTETEEVTSTETEEDEPKTSTETVDTKESIKEKERKPPRDFLGDVFDFANSGQIKEGRSPGWETVSNEQFGICKRVADLWLGGIMPSGQYGDRIEKQCAGALELLRYHGGDYRSTLTTVDAYHQQYARDGPGFSVAGPQSLIGVIPQFLQNWRHPDKPKVINVSA